MNYVLVKGSPNQLVFVNVYRITQQYGGSEEGGWWYHFFEGIESIPVKRKEARKLVKELEKKYAYLEDWNSKLGIYIEDAMFESQTYETPVYS